MEKLSKDKFYVRNFSGATGRVFELRGKLIDWDGIPAHIEYVRDITAQKSAENRSEELSTQQNSLYDHIGVGMCLYVQNNDGLTAVICNDKYRELFQLPKGFDEGKPIQLQLGNFFDEDRDFLLASIYEHIKNRTKFSSVCRIHDKQTGIPKSVLLNMDCQEINDETIYWYISAYDVTEWVESKARLNNVLDNFNGGTAVYQVSPDCNVKRLSYSDSLASMQGFEKEEYDAFGDNALKLVYAGDIPLLKEKLEESFKTKTAFSLTYRIAHKQKEYIWVNLNAIPIGIDADGCMRYTTVYTNASKQFELYRQMLDNSGNGLIVTDVETKEVYFTNKSANKILETDFNICIEGMRCKNKIECSRTLCDECMLLPRKDTVLRKVTSNGKTYQVYTHPMEWMEREAMAQYFSDITEETKLQKRLASDEERYRLVVERSGIALIDYDVRENKLYMNEEFKKYEASKSNMDDYFKHIDGFGTVHSEDVGILENFYKELEKANTNYARLRLKMQDGSYHWTEMNAINISDEKGNVIRKLGFFRDIDDTVRRYDDLKIRYDYEMARQGSFENGVVERILLDLTDNKVVQASNTNHKSIEKLVGMSVDKLLECRLAHTKGEKERKELCEFMDRDALTMAYYTGEHISLEMLARDPNGNKRYFTSNAQLAKNPLNGHIVAFIETRDNDKIKMEAILMRRLLETNYESAIVVDITSGKIKIGISAGDKEFTTDIDVTYDELARKEIISDVIPEEVDQTLEQMSLENIKKKLEKAKICSGRTSLRIKGEARYKTWTAVYFDDEKEYILITISNVTEVYLKDLQIAQELKDALESAKIASQAKNTFLARMSHEIRTPITTVSGILELLKMDSKNGELSNEVLLSQIETADSANKYLLTLINDILDISKIESNNISISLAETDVREVIIPMSAMIRTLAVKKSIRLVLDRKTNTSNYYMVDGVRLQQILMNLLNNAIKFTPEGGTVKFSGEVCQVKDNIATLKFVVSDTGVGISDEFKPYVFEPFKQEYENNNVYGGTGIGLSISKRLAQMMGGDITFESEKGKGSTFTAVLKLEVVDERKYTNKTNNNDDDIECEGNVPNLEGVSVMLCEDNLINQKIIKKILENAGCSVVTANDGQQALNRFVESDINEFDFILMDVQMPILDGLKATKKIRALNRADAVSIPIVAISANAYEEDRQISISSGMNEHLSKPVNTGELYRTIYKYVRKDRKDLKK